MWLADREIPTDSTDAASVTADPRHTKARRRRSAVQSALRALPRSLDRVRRDHRLQGRIGRFLRRAAGHHAERIVRVVVQLVPVGADHVAGGFGCDELRDGLRDVRLLRRRALVRTGADFRENNRHVVRGLQLRDHVVSARRANGDLEVTAVLIPMSLDDMGPDLRMTLAAVRLRADHPTREEAKMQPTRGRVRNYLGDVTGIDRAPGKGGRNRQRNAIAPSGALSDPY